MDHQRYEDYEPESLAAMPKEIIMSENKGRYIDQMMAALAKKNQQQRQIDSYRDPQTGEIKSKPRRNTGPGAGIKPMKKISGRGR